MERAKYRSPMPKVGLTRFTCPTCGKGRLKIKKDSLHFEETRESKRDHSLEAWDPEWIRLVYSCLLECSNTVCNDVISNSGVGRVDQFYDYDQDGNTVVDYFESFTPRYFTPHLRIFSPPKNAPPEVTEEIENSFSNFFSDPSSAANHMRIAIENLLTHLKIKRYITKNRRRIYLSLHKRIELLPPKLKNVQDLFFAVKWLGNAGSHSNKKITKDVVLDAYEIMDELLAEIFLRKRKKIKKLARKINIKKGPK